jgi:hypothetical protein
MFRLRLGIISAKEGKTRFFLADDALAAQRYKAPRGHNQMIQNGNAQNLPCLHQGAGKG